MVGAIGTMPRIAAAAVSRIGRKRCVVASTTASQGWRPCAFSVSTWSTRITELRAIMPVRASTPSSATKPSGLPESRRAATTPMRPSGATLSTRNSRLKPWSWTISTVSVRRSTIGSDGHHRTLRLVALLHRAADLDAVPGRQAGVQRRDPRREGLHDGGGQRAGRDVGLHRQRRPAVPAPDERVLLAVLDGGDLAQGDGPPVRQRHLQRPERRQRHALLGGGPDQHVDEVDPVPHLGGGHAGHDRVQGLGQVLGAQAERGGPGPGRPGSGPCAPAPSSCS